MGRRLANTLAGILAAWSAGVRAPLDRRNTPPLLPRPHDIERLGNTQSLGEEPMPTFTAITTRLAKPPRGTLGEAVETLTPNRKCSASSRSRMDRGPVGSCLLLHRQAGTMRGLALLATITGWRAFCHFGTAGNRLGRPMMRVNCSPYVAGDGFLYVHMAKATMADKVPTE